MFIPDREKRQLETVFGCIWIKAWGLKDTWGIRTNPDRRTILAILGGKNDEQLKLFISRYNAIYDKNRFWIRRPVPTLHGDLVRLAENWLRMDRDLDNAFNQIIVRVAKLS